MPARPFLPSTDPRLRQHAKPITKLDKACQTAAQDLIDTMLTHGLIGIAAPQIGVFKQLIALNGLYLEPQQAPLVMLNPKLIAKSGNTPSEEASPTVPNTTRTIKRSAYVKVVYTDLQGKRQLWELGEGHILVCALQHELDHLQGTLFIDHPEITPEQTTPT